MSNCILNYIETSTALKSDRHIIQSSHLMILDFTKFVFLCLSHIVCANGLHIYIVASVRLLLFFIVITDVVFVVLAYLVVAFNRCSVAGNQLWRRRSLKMAIRVPASSPQISNNLHHQSQIHQKSK